MDTTIVIALPVPITAGHRVQVIERADETGERSVAAVTDLDTQIRYQHTSMAGADTTIWLGRVRECIVTPTRGGVSTTLHIDPMGAAGSTQTDAALAGADAAAEAVTNEALRWGGGDHVSEPEPPRFW